MNLFGQIVHPARNIRAFRELIGLLTKHRALTLEMTKREITEQYVGQIFGVFWAVGHPLFLMALFVFIFNYVFKVRISQSLSMPQDYTTYILAGLLPWLGFQQIMIRACTVITSNASLVKQIVFPIEVLPAKTVFAGFVTQFISLMALIAYVLVVHGIPPGTYFLLPILFVIQLFAMLGVAFALASIGTYFRDAKDFVQVFSSWGIYMMPVVFLPEWVPEALRPILYINPLSYMIWSYQDALYYGRIVHPWSWFIFTVGSLIVFVAGYRLFRRAKSLMGSVL